MTGCEKAFKKVFDYLDGRLRKSGRREIQKHVEICRHCFSRYEFERKLLARLLHVSRENAPGRLRLKVREMLRNY